MQSPRAITRVAIAGLVALALLGATGKPAASPQSSTKRKLGATLVHACDASDNARALALLDAGADPNFEDKDGWTPLFYSASNNDVEMIQLLVARGADVNHAAHDAGSPLMYAAMTHDDGAVVALLNAGADVNQRDRDGYTPLIFAAFSGSAANAKRLLDSGASINADHGHSRRLGDNHGDTPLLHAIIALESKQSKSHSDRKHSPPASVDADNLRTVMVLFLDRGADPNCHDNFGTPLIRAATGGDLASVQLLLSKGADPNATDSDGGTAFHLAAVADSLPVVTALVEHGAGVDAVGKDGMTPLLYAAMMRHEQILEYLLQHNANPNAQEKFLDTPLHYAAFNGDLTAARALLDAGADPSIKNDHHNTARVIALNQGHRDLAQLVTAPRSSHLTPATASRSPVAAYLETVVVISVSDGQGPSTSGSPSWQMASLRLPRPPRSCGSRALPCT